MSTGAVDLSRGPLTEPEAGAIAARSPFELFWRRLKKDKVALAAGVFVLILVFAAVFAPLIVKLVGTTGPSDQNPQALDSFGTPTGSDRGPHLRRGHARPRRVLTRPLRRAGVAPGGDRRDGDLGLHRGHTGMIAGYYRGWTDTALSRLVDVLLAFPILLLGIGLASACSLGNGCAGGLIEPGLSVVIFVIAFVNWTYIYRIIRGQVLSLREKEFVEAARSLGASNRRILFREILPNLVAPIIVYSTLIIPPNILFEAALSFLGIGVQPPTRAGATCSPTRRRSSTPPGGSCSSPARRCF